MIRAGIFLAFFNGVAALLGLARTMLVARMISVEDFGIASSFAMTLALIDMSANIGISRLIVQAKDGEAPQLQAVLQGFQVLRGLVGGVALFLIAGPLASAFGVPHVTWAYQLMAALPVIGGFAHLDMARFQRNRRFAPSVIAETAAQTLSTVLAVAIAYYARDYRATLFALLAQQTAHVLFSHYFAERAFKLAWDPTQVRRAVGFGWPLLLNGLLMFAIFHGDRIIVGSQLGVGVLGWFAVAYMLTLTPSGLLAKVVHKLCLPALARQQDVPGRFAPMAAATIEAACLNGVLMAVGYALVGRPLVIALFGEKYAPALSVLVVLAVMQAVRVAKSGPSIVAISKAETTNPMFANLMRILFIPFAFLAAWKGADVIVLAWIALAGELAGLVVSYMLLAKRIRLDSRHLIRTFLATLAILSLPLAYDIAYPAEAMAITRWAGAALIAATGLYILQLSNFTRWMKGYILGKKAD